MPREVALTDSVPANLQVRLIAFTPGASYHSRVVAVAITIATIDRSCSESSFTAIAFIATTEKGSHLPLNSKHSTAFATTADSGCFGSKDHHHLKDHVVSLDAQRPDHEQCHRPT